MLGKFPAIGKEYEQNLHFLMLSGSRTLYKREGKGVKKLQECPLASQSPVKAPGTIPETSLLSFVTPAAILLSKVCGSGENLNGFWTRIPVRGGPV